MKHVSAPCGPEQSYEWWDTSENSVDDKAEISPEMNSVTPHQLLKRDGRRVNEARELIAHSSASLLVSSLFSWEAAWSDITHAPGETQEDHQEITPWHK